MPPAFSTWPIRAFLYFDDKGWKYFYALVFGIFLGAAFAVKFSNLTLVLILPLLYFLNKGKSAIAVSGRQWLLRVVKTAIVIFACFFLINAAYGFQGTFHRLGSHDFQSRLLQRVNKAIPENTPVPLPFHLVRGFDLQSRDNETMSGKDALVRWQGQWTNGPVHQFFPWLFATKLSISLLGLWLISLFFILKKPCNKQQSLERSLLIKYFTVAAVHFLFMAYIIQMYFGIRYMMQIIPFVVVMASLGGGQLRKYFSRRRQAAAVLIFLIAANGVLITYRATPHYLGFNNILLGSKQNWDKLDPDPTSDWGQDLVGLKDWMDEKGIEEIYMGYFGTIDPQFYGIDWKVPPPRPEEGVWAVSRNYIYRDLPHSFQFVREGKLRIIHQPKPYFGWLAGREPTHRIGRSINIYDFRKGTNIKKQGP